MFEAMDLYDYKTGILETNATHPFIHYACSEAIFRCLSMLPVSTVIDQKIALCFHNADRTLLSSYTAQSLKRTNHKGIKSSKKFSKSSSPCTL